MISSLLAKARNIPVKLKLRTSGDQFVGKIIDFDQMFAEVVVKIDEKSGEFANDTDAFKNGAQGWLEDRILINLHDISIVA